MMIRFFKKTIAFCGALAACASTLAQGPQAIRNPESAGFTLQPEVRIFALNRRQMTPATTLQADPAGGGLLLDLGDAGLFGRVHYGPAFFDVKNADYFESRFRHTETIKAGKARINVQGFLDPKAHVNVNDWKEAGVMGYRLELLRLRDGVPVSVGIYDSHVWFKVKGTIISPVLSIIEGPIVGLKTSDQPDQLVIGFETDRPSKAKVEVVGVGTFTDEALAMRHEITLTGLQPEREYRYRVLASDESNTSETPLLTFRTAPRKGNGRVVFGYSGDCRAAAGDGELQYIGVNRYVVSQIAKQAYRRNADFFLFGGDLIGGYTNSTEEFTMQMKAFKSSFAGFLHHAPLYSAQGNHEALLNNFSQDNVTLRMDKWPYETDSAEAVFARELIHPTNAPEHYPGTPSYRETVYSFHYGPVKVIVFNNNYWWTTTNAAKTFGGSPEGIILPNQMDWMRRELANAEADARVKYIVLLAQEPVFPNGGHVNDAMWYRGDNTVRGYLANATGVVAPASKGVLDIRNEFWEMLSRNRKVAAVLGSDEHNFHRTLITSQTPVGVPELDDLNRDGKLNDGRISPNANFKYPTWFMVSGGAGAPYYAQEDAPWSGDVKKFTAQSNYLVFTADAARIGVEVYSVSGQLLDCVEDLLAIKKSLRARP